MLTLLLVLLGCFLAVVVLPWLLAIALSLIPYVIGFWVCLWMFHALSGCM